MATGKVDFTPQKHVEYGTKQSGVSANSYITHTVTFSRAFADVNNCHIFLNIHGTGSSSNYGKIKVAYHSKTVSGFSIKVYNASGSTYSPVVEWIAAEF